MADKIRATLPITINGKNFDAVLKMSTLRAFEEGAGVGALAFWTQLRDRAATLTNQVLLIQLALQQGNPTLKPTEIDDLVDEIMVPQYFLIASGLMNMIWTGVAEIKDDEAEDKQDDAADKEAAPGSPLH